MENWLSWLEIQRSRIERKLDLLRGRLIAFRGGNVGIRFGLEQHVKIIYPQHFIAGDDVTIGEFSYLHCLSGKGVIIGSHTSIDRNLWLHCGGKPGEINQGFFKIGQGSYIGCNAVMGAGGGIEIGDNVLMGQSVNIHAENHLFNDPEKLIKQQGVSYQGVMIEDDVWIGSKVTILDGVNIGKGAVIGAGSIVTKSIPPDAVAVGVPAKVIRFRGMP